MKIELNKSYATRNGGVVKITIEDKYNNRPFGGFLDGRGSVFFSDNGSYDLLKQTEFDLVSEVVECKCENATFGGYENQVELKRPNHMIGQTEGSASDTICVDACLKGEIEHLWSLGISTTGCCCGHNIDPIYAFIGVVDEDIPKMKELGYLVAPNKTNPERADIFYSKTIYLT